LGEGLGVRAVNLRTKSGMLPLTCRLFDSRNNRNYLN
jgi:hypothetical protein